MVFCFSRDLVLKINAVNVVLSPRRVIRQIRRKFAANKIMKNSKSLFIIAFVFLVIAMFGLSQFSQDVRAVNIVGLFFSGGLCGAAAVNLIAALRAKNQNGFNRENR